MYSAELRTKSHESHEYESYHDRLHLVQKTFGVAGGHPLEDFARFGEDPLWTRNGPKLPEIPQQTSSDSLAAYLSLGGVVALAAGRGARRRSRRAARAGRLLARARPLLGGLDLPDLRGLCMNQVPEVFFVP